MILLLILLILIVFLIHQFWYRRRGLPIGPTPVPFIGNVAQIWNCEKWEVKLLEWKQIYGKVFTLWLGNIPMVNVNDYKLATELFVHQGSNFEEREPMQMFAKAARGGLYGVIDTSGSLWKEQRRFCLKTLRDFGLGKNQMQQRILDEMATICENINKEIDASVVEHDLHKHTDMATGSVINAVICGYRFSTNGKEQEFYTLKETTKGIMRAFSDLFLNLAVNNDYLLNLPYFKAKFDKAVDLFATIFKFLNGVIAEHEKHNDYTMEMEPHDFIDAYMMEMQRSEERGESHYFSKIQLSNIAFDLWFAGQETTSSTITWAVAFLIRHPECQQKLHEELDRVIGSDRMITNADKPQLPYTQAVIMEVQRVANIIPVNLLRKSAKDMEIEGCLIRKGTIFIPQMSVIMIDPENFKDPMKFNPSRFIDSNGSFKPADEVIPFSIGKRQCLGEGLARMELFLFISNLFNQYKINATSEPPTLERLTSGVSPETKPYKCLLERRF